MKAIVIAGTSSGTGKTTVAIGLMAALRRRGLKVQGFKVGPDYIDPGFHTWATGVPSRNVDTWMLPRHAVLELFSRAMAGKDIAIVEGVMGLYDGRSADKDEGSTAEVAKLLDLPVLLVIDCHKAGASVAAMALGYKALDRDIKLAGVALNGLGSRRHLEMCRDAVQNYAGTRVLGHLFRSPGLSIPERHLGLLPAAEAAPDESLKEKLARQVEEHFCVDEILLLAERSETTFSAGLFPPAPVRPTVRIAVARDKAFSFYYQDSLDLLSAWGAEMVPFSPLQDSCLPQGISGLYIGGGFPEMYAEDLTRNDPMLQSVRNAASKGLPVYAECGGLMYLGGAMRDLEGVEHRMVGLLPLRTQIDSPRLSLGYRTVRALADGPFLRKGEEVRGHEFHWSTLSHGEPGMNAYLVVEADRPEGFQIGSTFASYIHLHLAARKGMAQRFIEVCNGPRR
ncbi:MAG: cobyrinate a,c-diamide synthase [Chloroflexi bacterium]|nr:cobyrinate a,c-diamide synthase [Chloroflexota bacterium]